ncbi:MAG: ABC transporter ATP-binding protein [Proteobacteria bacterium]|nr:ABC transporter ATP-binding protein [Pseudomonadota bacterium]
MNTATHTNNGASPPLLQINNLHISVVSPDSGKRTEIVNGVSLQLTAGRVLGLIGESGAGKSTIGLAALVHGRGGCHISSGEVLLDGVDLCRLSEAEKRRLRGGTVSYVAQSAAAAFNPAYRLEEQILEVTQLHSTMNNDEAHARMVSLFTQLGLPQPELFGRKFPHQASGGQLQRAMTAMALICHPKLVVFDEPTTALDVTTQLDVLAAIKKVIREENTASLYISHDLAVVAQIADEILVLRHGNKVEQAATAELINQPQEEYTSRLLAVRHLHKEGETATTQAPLLQISGISAAYGGSKELAVNDISATVHAGRTLAVVGESGSGKSTLARVICGLLPPIAGNITFAGAPLPPTLAQRTRAQIHQIQMVHQTPDTALNPRNTVQEIIGRVLTLCGGLTGDAHTTRLRELLQQVELEEELLTRYPPQLSGGQKQRVVIARALATDPQLIVCDEPTSALDPLIAADILRLLLLLQKERGVSYLFITHDISVVRAIADDIIVMHNGLAVTVGSREEVLNPPHDPYTELLLASVPEMRPGWLEEALATRQLESGGQ